MLIWIERHLRTLRIISAISFIAAVAVVLGGYFVIGDQTVTIKPYQLGLLVLPWLTGFGSSIPITYHSWFKDPPQGMFASIVRVGLCVFFWIFVSGVVIVFIGIYGNFVLRR